jgi:hypothetical protein
MNTSHMNDRQDSRSGKNGKRRLVAALGGAVMVLILGAPAAVAGSPPAKSTPRCAADTVVVRIAADTSAATDDLQTFVDYVNSHPDVTWTAGPLGLLPTAP